MPKHRKTRYVASSTLALAIVCALNRGTSLVQIKKHLLCPNQEYGLVDIQLVEHSNGTSPVVASIVLAAHALSIEVPLDSTTGAPLSHSGNTFNIPLKAIHASCFYLEPIHLTLQQKPFFKLPVPLLGHKNQLLSVRQQQRILTYLLPDLPLDSPLLEEDPVLKMSLSTAIRFSASREPVVKVRMAVHRSDLPVDDYATCEYTILNLQGTIPPISPATSPSRCVCALDTAPADWSFAQQEIARFHAAIYIFDNVLQWKLITEASEVTTNPATKTIRNGFKTAPDILSALLNLRIDLGVHYPAQGAAVVPSTADFHLACPLLDSLEPRPPLRALNSPPSALSYRKYISQLYANCQEHRLHQIRQLLLS